MDYEYQTKHEEIYNLKYSLEIYTVSIRFHKIGFVLEYQLWTFCRPGPALILLWYNQRYK
jgi:hypothetical protein